MTHHDPLSSDDRRLWQTAKDAWAAGDDAPLDEPLLLAAYLEGRLTGMEVERAEALLAASPATLDLLLASRTALGEGLEAPESLIARAEGLVRPLKPARQVGGGTSRWRSFWWAAATAVLLLGLSVGGFELGRFGYAQAETLVMQSVEAGPMGVSSSDLSM